MSKTVVDPDNKAICPNCSYEFDFNETFGWMADPDGHPTVESLYCPHCGIATYRQYDCARCPGRIKNTKITCTLEEECAVCATVDYYDFFLEEI